MNKVWLDGKIVHQKDARIPCFEHGVLYGQGLFETMRCYRGRVFALAQHLRRLRQSCPVLGIRPPSEKILRKAVMSVIERNGLHDAALRLNVSKAGAGSHVFVFAKKPVLPRVQDYKKGYSLLLVDDEKITPSVLGSTKSFNHFFYIRLTQAAQHLGFDEAVFLNSQGYVVEGSRTNIFIVLKGKVVTPDVSCGCLPGVTRALVLSLMKKHKISFVERCVLPQELKAADEIFVTNSLVGIMPATKLDKKRIGCGKPGRLTQRLAKGYEKIVEHECRLR